MCTVAEMLRRLQGLDLNAVAIEVIEQTEDEIIALNQQQLYNKSEDRNSINLKDYKSKYYAGKKFVLNPRPGLFHPDLNLTGSFYRGFFVSITSPNSFAIGSYDVKSVSLESRYGKGIFGLNKASLSRYAKGAFYIPYRAKIRAQLGIKQ